jgi:hypothetical protein
LMSESTSCLLSEKNVCVPGKAAIKMKSKVSYMVLLRYLHVSRLVVNVMWTDLVSLALIHQSRSQDE